MDPTPCPSPTGRGERGTDPTPGLSPNGEGRELLPLPPQWERVGVRELGIPRHPVLPL
jgi:hypothetical protein